MKKTNEIMSTYFAAKPHPTEFSLLGYLLSKIFEQNQLHVRNIWVINDQKCKSLTPSMIMSCMYHAYITF